MDARHGIAAETWQAAGSVAELRTASELARRQLAAAQDVAAARAMLDQPLDLVQQVGRFATDVPAVNDAILAVREADDDAAAQSAARIRDTVANLRATGEQRIFVGSFVLLATLLGLAAFATRRAIDERARRAEARRLASVVAVATAHPARPEAISPVNELWDRAPMDDSPTQRWDGPAQHVVPTVEGDPEIAKLVRPRPPAPKA